MFRLRAKSFFLLGTGCLLACGPASAPSSTESSSEALADAPAGGPKQVRTYGWQGITDRNWDDGVRRIQLRVAAQFAYDDGKPSYMRGYVALTCRVKSGSTWRPYPCSMSETLLENGLSKDWNVGTSNSGSDGFYSAYTGWARDPDLCYVVAVEATRLGLHSKYFSSSKLSTGDKGACVEK